MPKTKLGRPAPDVLKGIVKAALEANGLGIRDLAPLLSRTESAAYKWMKLPSSEWRLSDLLVVSRKLGIPIEDIRNTIRY